MKKSQKLCFALPQDWKCFWWLNSVSPSMPNSKITVFMIKNTWLPYKTCFWWSSEITFNVRRAFPSQLRYPGFKSWPGTVSGPASKMWGAQPNEKTKLRAKSCYQGNTKDLYFHFVFGRNISGKFIIISPPPPSSNVNNSYMGLPFFLFQQELVFQT